LSQEIVERFENKVVVRVIDEFNHLRQRGTLEEYKSKFEELRAALLRCNPYYDDEHFRQSFIGGLKEELKAMVMAHMPTTLKEAYSVAAHQELVLELIYRKIKVAPKHIHPHSSSISKPMSP
jgi:hypothetical protein